MAKGKPKNASEMMMVRNAKKNKVSKNPNTRYPTSSEIESFLGIRMKDRKFK